MSKDAISGSATPAHLIESYATRKARSAPARKVSIAREAAKLAAIYARLKLPVPMRLTPLPLPEPAATFIPFAVKRQRGHQPAGHGTVRATAIIGRGHRATGRATGRPPNKARAAAIKSGARTYRGLPCRHNHPEGIRYVIGSLCVRCQKAAHDARKRGRPVGTWASVEIADKALGRGRYGIPANDPGRIVARKRARPRER